MILFTYCGLFVNLSVLASLLLVTAKDVNQRMERYKWILVEMESRPDNNLTEPLENIELTDWEKQQFIDALNGEIYSMTAKRRNYIIQRLDSFLSDGGATYNTKLFTIEHVLPQHPSADSEWMKLWPDTQTQRFWLNKIANLVPLTRQRNSAAQNYDFNTKKIKLCSSCSFYICSCFDKFLLFTRFLLRVVFVAYCNILGIFKLEYKKESVDGQ